MNERGGGLLNHIVTEFGMNLAAAGKQVRERGNEEEKKRTIETVLILVTHFNLDFGEKKKHIWFSI